MVDNSRIELIYQNILYTLTNEVNILSKLEQIIGSRTKRIDDIVNIVAKILKECEVNQSFEIKKDVFSKCVKVKGSVCIGRLFYEGVTGNYKVSKFDIITYTWRLCNINFPKSLARRLCRDGLVNCKKEVVEDREFWVINVIDLLNFIINNKNIVVESIKRSLKMKEIAYKIWEKRIEKRRKFMERCNYLISIGAFENEFECSEYPLLDDNWFNNFVNEHFRKIEEEVNKLRREYEKLDDISKLITMLIIVNKYAKLNSDLYKYKEDIVKYLLIKYPSIMEVKYLQGFSYDYEEDMYVHDPYYDLYEIKFKTKTPLTDEPTIHIPVPRAQELGISTLLDNLVKSRGVREFGKYGSPPNTILMKAFPLEFVISEIEKLINKI